VKKQIEKELGRRFEDIFDFFEEKPIGSASLAQVHKAILKGEKNYVAVKVQHPEIGLFCPADVKMVRFATKVGEFIFPKVKLQWIGKEFHRNIMKEIDFTIEAHNADKIRNYFQDDPSIVIPKIRWDYTTSKLLVMSFEEGKSIVDTEWRKRNKINVNEIATLLANCFNKQIFEFGFVHSDPHHGNLLIRKEIENGKNVIKLVLLDHGLYRTLDEKFRFYYALLWRGRIFIIII
jgi:aarF domain-containing kinase